MPTLNQCPQCGADFPVGGPQGVCPACFFAIGIAGGEGQSATADVAGCRSDPPKPADLADYFPRLEILDLIGQGGMGAVYKARQRDLDRIVALKILPPSSAEDATFAERFGRESRALAKLNHPHIVGLYDSGRAGDLYYLFMEFVDGVNLRQTLQSGHLSASEALAIIPQICDALQYAHDEGIVHRDIKPENVLLDQRGRVKIADFGLARMLNPLDGDISLTGTHQVMGTPRYMSPEQMEGIRKVDHRADIYSLGVVFYELLTGELPLGRFDAPSHKVQLDVRLDDVVLRTLEKEPERRYQQASQIKTDVESIVGRSAVDAAIARKLGYEYRSAVTVFGWPVVHVAMGVDPVTRRRRIAKGIIAIGDVAIGVVALGGVAVGGLALGGCGIGLMTCGGLSVGLLFALGGAAIGLGISVGGLAVGAVAVGGAAIGIVAIGGGAFAVFPVGANAQDPATVQILQENGRWISEHKTLVFGAIAVLACLLISATLGSMALVQQMRLGSPDKKSHPIRDDSSTTSIGMIVALCLLAPCVLGFALAVCWRIFAA